MLVYLTEGIEHENYEGNVTEWFIVSSCSLFVSTMKEFS